MPGMCIAVIQMICFANGIRMLKIGSSVYQIEMQVVDRLYDWELYDILVKLKTKESAKGELLE